MLSIYYAPGNELSILLDPEDKKEGISAFIVQYQRQHLGGGGGVEE